MRRDLPEAVDSAQLLAEILQVLRSIDGKLERQRAHTRDPLEIAIRAFLGSGVAFSAAALIEQAGPELRALIGSDANRLGRRLSRIEGRGVERVGEDQYGVIWATSAGGD